MFTFFKRFHILTILKIALITSLPMLAASQLTGCAIIEGIVDHCRIKTEIVRTRDGKKEQRTTFECGGTKQEKEHSTPNSLSFFFATLCQSAPEICDGSKEQPDTIQFKTTHGISRLQRAVSKVLGEVKIHAMSTAGSLENGIAELKISMETDEGKQALSIPLIVTDGYATFDDVVSASELLTQMVIAAQNKALRHVKFSVENLSFVSNNAASDQRADTMTLTVFLDDKVLMTMTSTVGDDATRPGTGIIQEMR